MAHASIPQRGHLMRRQARRAVTLLLVSATAYLAAAYLLLPRLWESYIERHPALSELPGITRTSDGHPGDPINVVLIGRSADLEAALGAAGWQRADAITLKSSVEIAADSLLDRNDAMAPVSSLYFWGRKQDIAFEKEVGGNPSHRHHVRFWRSKQFDAEGRPLWAGSATYDRSVGFSHTTGQITHHIAPELDVERAHLIADLQTTGRLAELYFVDEFHKIRTGRNGGGDPWHTDGRLGVATLKTVAP